jgi:hypothetical protein
MSAALTPEQRSLRAVAIKALVNDPNVKEAFAAIEADLVAEWKSSRTTDERENCWRAIDVMERLKAWLNSAQSHDLTALRRSSVQQRH